MKTHFEDRFETSLADQPHKPAQLGPVAATAAPTREPTPPKKPPMAALRPIETAQSPAWPPSRSSISSKVNFLMMLIIKLIGIDQHIKIHLDWPLRVTPTGLV
jgi:hypothetical protein